MPGAPLMRRGEPPGGKLGAGAKLGFDVVEKMI
jgi:hypothetical protein